MSLLFYISAFASAIYAQNGVGHSESGVKMTYYGSDFSLVEGTKVYTGDVPPYQPYGYGACGIEPIDKNYFVAMNNNAYAKNCCGMCAKVTYNGNCVVAPIVDRCPGCGGGGSGLDVSIQAFGELVGGEAKAREMGVAYVNFEIVPCPSWRASTGSPFTSNVDPCSGSTLTGSFNSASDSGNQRQAAAPAVSSSTTTTVAPAKTTEAWKPISTEKPTTTTTTTTSTTKTKVTTTEKKTETTKTKSKATSTSTADPDNFIVSSSFILSPWSVSWAFLFLAAF